MTGNQPGTQVVVTRFECRTRLRVLIVLALHWRVKRAVRVRVSGWLGSATVTDWRSRTVLSISLWHDLRSVYGMGDIPVHVQAARVPRRLGIATVSGIYSYSGDWRRLMFGTPADDHEPLIPTQYRATDEERSLHGESH